MSKAFFSSPGTNFHPLGNDFVLSQMRYLLYHCCCLVAQSCLDTFATSWTVAHQDPLSTDFPRQEYWSGLPFPSPGDLLDSGSEPMSLVSPAMAGGFFSTGKPPSILLQCNKSSNFLRKTK